jgi:hypothetical protein
VLDTLAPCGAEQLPPVLSFPAARCDVLAPDAEEWVVETKRIDEEVAQKALKPPTTDHQNTTGSIF